MPSQVKYPLTASQNSANDNAWISVDEIKTNNNTGAVVSESTIGHGIQGSGTDTVFSHLLTVSNFDFSIPSGATINGLTVTLRASATVAQETTSAPTAKYYLNLAQNGTPVGSSPDGSLTTSGTYATYTWGGATNKLGTSVTPSDVNASTFQVQLYAELNCPYSAEFDNGEWINFFGSSVDVDADYITLEVHYTEPKEIDVVAGSFALTGVNANLLFSRRMTADVATFTCTGSALGFRRTFRYITSSTSYAWSGIDAGLARNRAVFGDTANFALTGTDTNLRKTSVLVADTRSYALTGIDANTLYHRIAGADATTYALTSINTGLVGLTTLSTDWFQYTGVGYVIEANAGSYTLTGIDADLKRGFVIQPVVRTYAVNGIDVGLRRALLATTVTGTYTLSGIDNAFSRGKYFNAEAGDYLLNSPGVILRRTDTGGNLLVFFL